MYICLNQNSQSNYSFCNFYAGSMCSPSWITSVEIVETHDLAGCDQGMMEWKRSIRGARLSEGMEKGTESRDYYSVWEANTGYSWDPFPKP